jgi:hypothetical protein
MLRTTEGEIVVADGTRLVYGLRQRFPPSFVSPPSFAAYIHVSLRSCTIPGTCLRLATLFEHGYKGVTTKGSWIRAITIAHHTLPGIAMHMDTPSSIV